MLREKELPGVPPGSQDEASWPVKYRVFRAAARVYFIGMSGPRALFWWPERIDGPKTGATP